MVLIYDYGASYLATAIRFKSTVFPAVLSRSTFYFFLALHLFFHLSYRHGYLPGAQTPGSLFFADRHDVQVVTALTTFFIVFYSNQTFERYLHLYDTTRKLLVKVKEFVAESSLYLDVDARNHVRLACRYCIASVLLFIFDAKGDEETTEEDWDILYKYGLIKRNEQQILKDFNTMQRSHVMLNWSAAVIRDGHALCLKNKTAPGNAINSLVPKLCDMRDNEQDLLDTMRLPIPFQYFHLLNVMLVVNFFLWSYAMAVTDSIFAPVTYIFAVLIFMGMMELSSQLCDPFGDDETDFPLGQWMEEILSQCVVLVEELDKYPDFMDAAFEDAKNNPLCGGAQERIDLSPDEQTHLIGKTISKHGSIIVT